MRCNRAAVSLTGIPGKLGTGSDFERRVIFPADIERWRLEITRAFDGLFSRWFEIRWNCLAGVIRPLACSFSPIRDRNGSIVCVCCTAVPCHSGELLADRALELREIARFLHDTLAQDLAALACSLGMTGRQTRRSREHREIAAPVETAERCCRNVRILAAMLEAPAHPRTAIERSIEEMAGYLREEAGVAMMLDIDPVSEALPEDARMLLLTAFQQWTAKSIRRSPKPELTVRLRERRHSITLELEAAVARHPEGQRAQEMPAAFSSGWSAIRERTKALGGEFAVARRATAVRLCMVLPVATERVE